MINYISHCLQIKLHTVQYTHVYIASLQMTITVPFDPVFVVHCVRRPACAEACDHPSLGDDLILICLVLCQPL